MGLSKIKVRLPVETHIQYWCSYKPVYRYHHLYHRYLFVSIALIRTFFVLSALFPIFFTFCFSLPHSQCLIVWVFKTTVISNNRRDFSTFNAHRFVLLLVFYLSITECNRARPLNIYQLCFPYNYVLTSLNTSQRI